MAPRRDRDWLLLLAVLYVLLDSNVTGAPDTTTTSTTPTVSPYYAYTSAPDPTSTAYFSTSSPSTQQEDATTSTHHTQNSSRVGPGVGSSPSTPGRPPLCAVDVAAREAVCDAAVLQGLPPPHVHLPNNITRLVVTTQGVGNMGRTFLNRALNDHNFTSLHSLERLTINNFGLSQLQNSTFSALPFLEFLDLSHNQIQNLQDVTFVGLSKLETLNLSFNHISVIQAEYFNLPSLKHLVVSSNRFLTVPSGAFRLLPVLQTLTLDGNDLGSLTSGDAFLGLDHLRELHLSDCNLDVPHSLFDHTQSVDTLYLDHNSIQSIPSEAIKQLYFLQTLVLSNNKIRSIQNEAFQGLAVRVLDLSNNSISKISRQAFSNFRTEELYLQNNLLEDVPKSAMEVFARHLFVMDLSGNPLEHSEVELPADLTYLHTLNLSHTGLTHLPYSLRHLYQLQTLDISYNLIPNFNDSGTRLLRRLESVALQGNPWNCDCGIVPLQEWLQHQLQLAQGLSSSVAPPLRGNVSALSCSRPDDLAGRAVVSASSSQLAHCSANTWKRGLPVAIYITCSLIALGMIGLVVFMWRKRHEMGYGRFCMDKDTDGYSEPQSPIKVISNPAAGATDLPRRAFEDHPSPYSDHSGPVKNQAWESALVISNPHRISDGAVGGENRQSNGKVPGAETIV